MAVKYNMTKPEMGQYDNFPLESIKHIDGNIYKFVDVSATIVSTIPAGIMSDSQKFYFTVPDGCYYLKLSGPLYWRHYDDDGNWGCIMVDTIYTQQLSTKGLQYEVHTTRPGVSFTNSIQTISIMPGQHYWCPGAGRAKTYNSVNIIASPTI